MTGILIPQRSRTKMSDLLEIFRSSHSSRPLPETDALPDTLSQDKYKSKRSVLPFLRRKKTDRAFVSSSALPGRLIDAPSASVGKELLAAASSADGFPSDDRLPSTLPSPPLNASPLSLGSKFAANFSPLRSPIKTLKLRYSSSYKSTNTPTTRSSVTLSPPVADCHGAALESCRSSTVNSRPTTPKSLLQPSAENAPYYEIMDDFSDLFYTS
ncbi:uncharacterized protein BJ212DRAFT_1487927 [Suillus subaureus]|uniref:Uncharacterized protein n=1 Tax=Suillus subaureus TaxID=48587 RepID=A0A9P7J3G8_9AGAM|nr:uncharacterized protein BJ212DRAFT_1487927 [Suillus subaureus]KAG1800644.1 hypothetical protein BJ212DRAFT_1487927 [Suillus subaureus]